MMMINYIKEQGRGIFLFIIVVAISDVYLFYFCHVELFNELLYLNIFLLVMGLIYLFNRYFAYKKIAANNNEVILSSELNSYIPLIGRQIVAANNQYYQNELKLLEKQLHNYCNYVEKNIKGTKLPLGSLRLLNEKTQDLTLKKNIGMTIEQLQSLSNTLSLSSKLTNPKKDINFEKISLLQVVKESLKHQAYFLSNDHFVIDVKVNHEHVYSDRRWLTLMLDQIITNAIKYKQKYPQLTFGVDEIDNKIVLIIDDNGIGINQNDLLKIKDLGTNTSNHSTNMNLYFACEIARLLEIDIEVEEVFDGSCLKLVFKSNL